MDLEYYICSLLKFVTVWGRATKLGVGESLAYLDSRKTLSRRDCWIMFIGSGYFTGNVQVTFPARI